MLPVELILYIHSYCDIDSKLNLEKVFHLGAIRKRISSSLTLNLNLKVDWTPAIHDIYAVKYFLDIPINTNTSNNTNNNTSNKIIRIEKYFKYFGEWLRWSNLSEGYKLLVIDRGILYNVVCELWVADDIYWKKKHPLE